MKRINQILVFLLLGSALTANAQKSMDNKTTTLKLTSKWDKVFPQSNKVERRRQRSAHQSHGGKHHV